MTIAACYLSPEGVVFGADSTTTMHVSGLDPTASASEHYYNFAQKIFQVGESSTLAITMWGLGSLHNLSYRTLIARFADLLAAEAAGSVEDVARRWSQFFWSAYSSNLSQVLERARHLSSRPLRTTDEQRELLYLLQAYSVGFCLGGYLASDRTPCAFEILFDPSMTEAGRVHPLPLGRTRFWGCPNLIERLVFGIDAPVLDAILRSGKWTGTEEDLINMLLPHRLTQPSVLPIREAIDWVHASIYATIKMMKFSQLAPVCGGPIEIAVVTTDRNFRWVRHKQFDAAIGEGGP